MVGNCPRRMIRRTVIQSVKIEGYLFLIVRALCFIFGNPIGFHHTTTFGTLIDRLHLRLNGRGTINDDVWKTIYSS
jgi:hypothetical protein